MGECLGFDFDFFCNMITMQIIQAYCKYLLIVMNMDLKHVKK